MTDEVVDFAHWLFFGYIINRKKTLVPIDRVTAHMCSARFKLFNTVHFSNPLVLAFLEVLKLH